MLCLVLNGSTIEDDLTLCNKYNYVDIAELRADFLDICDPNVIEKIRLFPSMVDKPVILTLRRKSDGGKYSGDENFRLKTLYSLAGSGFAYVDLEGDLGTILDSFFEKGLENNFVKECSGSGLKSDFSSLICCPEKNYKIIRSIHFFSEEKGCLSKLADKIEKFVREQSRAGFIPKAAISVNSVEDLVTLYDISNNLSDIKDKIIVGTGEYGIPSRILYRKFGSSLMYVVSDEACNERGFLFEEKNFVMVGAGTLKNIYHADLVSVNTKVFGVIGNPVYHSASPVFHNNGFAKSGLDCIYVPFLVDELASFFELCERLEIQGFSITSPFKGAVLPFLSEKGVEVEKSCACNTALRKKPGTAGRFEAETSVRNTVLREKQGYDSRFEADKSDRQSVETGEQNSWIGYNTDIGAVVDIFFDMVKGYERKVRVLVLGAGGAAAAVVYGFMKLGAEVVVFNRTVERAKALAEKAGCIFDSLENIKNYSGKADIIASSISSDVDLTEGLSFSGNEIALDLLYHPLETKFLKRAKECGLKIITGLDFLNAQAALQFKYYSENSSEL